MGKIKRPLLGLILSALLALPAYAGEKTPPSKIAVDGAGIVTRPVENYNVVLVVTTFVPFDPAGKVDAQKFSASHAAKVSALLTAARAIVGEENWKSALKAVSPQFQQTQRHRPGATNEYEGGLEMTSNISVCLEGQDRDGKLARLYNVGGVDLVRHTPNLSEATLTEARQEALQKAVANATAIAEQLSFGQELGVPVVRQTSERGSYGVGAYRGTESAMAMAADQGQTVVAGDISVSANVHLEYNPKPKKSTKKTP